MKKLILFCFLLSTSLWAQNVNIPDANFKSAILDDSNGKIDTNNDGEIQVSEAKTVTKLLLGFSNISDMTGIEVFVNLNELSCRNNQISVLNISGLTQLTSLSCGDNQIRVLDVSGLTNLKDLSCHNNQISVLDVSGLTKLIHLSCAINQISILDVSGLTQLTSLSCGSNQIRVLDVSGLINLPHLECSDNQISVLNVSRLTQLTYLYCSYNHISVLDVSGLTKLIHLSCAINQISILDVSGLTELTYFQCRENQISVLDVTNLSKLDVLYCSKNQINVLNVSKLIKLKYFDCSNNQIEILDFSRLTELESISCSNNQIANLDLTNNLNLISLLCHNNKLTTIDLSKNKSIRSLKLGNSGLIQPDLSNLEDLRTFKFTNSDWTYVDLSKLKTLNEISFDNNPNLEYVNLKNKQINKIYYKEINWDPIYPYYGVAINNPKLKYICIDENQLASLKDSLSKYKMNVEVNTYCSFDPSGNYNTILGQAVFDTDNNGCDAADALRSKNIKVNLNDGTTQGATVTDVNGAYKFYTDAGTFDLKPSFEKPSHYNVNPVKKSITFADSLNNTATADFCITANGVHPDLEIVVAPVGVARPGFDASYQVVYKNKGNQTLSGDLSLVFNDSVLDFLSSSVLATETNGNLSWTYDSLKPFESKVIDLKFNVNSPMETPAVNLGDTLNFIATINPTSGEDTPNDNTFEFNQIVVGAYDPNQITCLEGTSLDPIEAGNYLHYFIECENTGTYPAENVVMKVVVDTLKYDLNSLQVLSSSDPVYVRIKGNVVEYVFENIQLAEKAHGNVLIKIKSKSTLTKGDYVAKQANIYFDYNFPVTTNEAKTIYQILGLGLKDSTGDESIQAFPNPNNGIFQVKAEQAINSIHVYDQYGRLLETRLNPSVAESNFNLSNEAKGLYFLKVTTDKGVKMLEISVGN